MYIYTSIERNSCKPVKDTRSIESHFSGPEVCRGAIKFSSPPPVTPTPHMPTRIYSSCSADPNPGANRSLPFYRRNRGCSSGRQNCPRVPAALSPKIGVVFEGWWSSILRGPYGKRIERPPYRRKGPRLWPPILSLFRSPSFPTLKHPLLFSTSFLVSQRCSSVYLRVFARACHAIRIMECIDDAPRVSNGTWEFLTSRRGDASLRKWSRMIRS